MATVIQAYRFALDPTPRQRRALASHCGAARYAYNWAWNSSRPDSVNAALVRTCRCRGACSNCNVSGT
jgi:hypothetical protein